MVVALPKTTTLHWSSAPSPHGSCVVMATERGICWAGTPGTPLDTGLAWLRRRMDIEHVVESEATAPLQLAMEQLRRYLEGPPLRFRCPLDCRGPLCQLAV